MGVNKLGLIQTLRRNFGYIKVIEIVTVVFGRIQADGSMDVMKQ